MPKKKQPTKPAKKQPAKAIRNAAREPKVTLIVTPKGKVARLPGPDKRSIPMPWWPEGDVTVCVDRDPDGVVVTGWSRGVDTKQAFRERFLPDVITQWFGLHGSAWKFRIITADGTTVALKLGR